MPTAAPGYSAFARTAHWLTAVLVFAGFGLGWWMVDLPLSPDRVRAYAWHKWIGVGVFAIVLLRLAARCRRAPPPLPEATPRWQRLAAAGSHRLLYLLLCAVPLSGWLMSSAKGFQTVWFGVLPIPDLLERDLALAAALESLHWALNKLLIGVVAVHALAALKHHFVDRDEVLLQMLPWRRRP